MDMEGKYGAEEAKLANDAGAESSDDENDDFQFKVILLGDGAVGKTSIATRFSQDHFAKPYKQTIGLDLFLKRLELPGGSRATLQVWDIGGQTIGGNMVGNYIYGAHAVLLCYDVTNYYSFQNLEDWLRLVKRTFKDEKMPALWLCANKVDLGHIRTVNLAKHTQFANENDMHEVQISAKSGYNVNLSFSHITANLCGVTLTKSDMAVATVPVEANIVQYQRNDDSVVVPKLRGKDFKCVIQ